jgi:peroxiredoxin
MINTGIKIPNITLPSINGEIFNSSQLQGKPFMLSFFRFASCPFCNLRIFELSKKFDELGEDFTIVAIFNSPIDRLSSQGNKHNAPFYILADEFNKYYQQYGIENSVLGMIKGWTLRLPILVKGLLKGYIPLEINHKWTIMPASFLIDKEGVIQRAYYGKDEGDPTTYHSMM